MLTNLEAMQKLGETGLDTTMRLFGAWNKNWQALASEMSAYTKRSFDNGTTTFEKLMAAKTINQAVEIQTNFTRRAFDDYMQELTKIGGLYSRFATNGTKAAAKPD